MPPTWPITWHDPQQGPVAPMLVRPVSLGDHSAVAALFASAGLRPVSTVSPHGCCVATAGGAPERVIGFGAQWHVRLDKFRMDLLVAPDWRRQGVGTHLLSHLVKPSACCWGRDAASTRRERRPGVAAFPRSSRLRRDDAHAPAGAPRGRGQADSPRAHAWCTHSAFGDRTARTQLLRPRRLIESWAQPRAAVFLRIQS